jgi:hypothetical protein
MGKKIIEDIPAGLTKLYKSHVPTLEVVEVRVNAVHFHKGTEGDYSDRANYSIELIDENGQILPRMVCERVPNGNGYLIKNNLHLTESDAYKRLAKNIGQVVEKSNPGIDLAEDSVLAKNLEILKDKYPHFLI